MCSLLRTYCTLDSKTEFLPPLDLDRIALQVDRPPGVENAGPMIYWMASRATTQPEDRAYALMGILDLQLPISYGEGFDAAFFRLQIAILQRTTIIQPWIWVGTLALLKTRLQTIMRPSKRISGGKQVVLEATLTSRGRAPGADLHVLPMACKIQMFLFPVHILDTNSSHSRTDARAATKEGLCIRFPQDIAGEGVFKELLAIGSNLVLGIFDSSLDEQLDKTLGQNDGYAIDQVHCYAFLLQKHHRWFPHHPSYSRLPKRPFSLMCVSDGSCGLLRASKTIYVL